MTTRQTGHPQDQRHRRNLWPDEGAVRRAPQRLDSKSQRSRLPPSSGVRFRRRAERQPVTALIQGLNDFACRVNVSCAAPDLNQSRKAATQPSGMIQRTGRGNARRPVSRVLSPPLPAGDDHSSRAPVARRLARPTRATARKHACPANRTCRPYLVLLRVGFAMPPLLPGARCALTAPFHPYRWAEARRRFAFCCTVPGVAPAGRYPAPLFPWSPDFPRLSP
jgi:hypothetical protein